MQAPIGLMTELRSDEIPYIFAEFQRRVGEAHWLRRVNDIKAHLRGQPFLRDLLHQENWLAFSLAACSELAAKCGGMLPLHATTDRALYPAYAFMAQTLSMIESTDPKNADGIISRIRGGLRNNPPDLRAMELELHVANHFVSRGYHVEWPEMSKSGQFDLLVSGLGNGGLEVECKSISSDKGRSVHRKDALDFFHLVRTDIEAACRGVSGGLAVVLTVPGRLPSQLSEKRQLAKRAISALVQGKDQQFPDRVTITVSDFDPAEVTMTEADGRPVVSREAIDKVTGTVNRETMIIGNRSGGVVVVVVQSLEDDELLESVFAMLSNSAKRQLTGTRAALFCAGFSDLTPEQMVSLARHDHDAANPATALRRGVSRFLANSGRDHLVGVSFISQSQLMETSADVVSNRGSAYHFSRRESKFWHDDFEDLVRT